MSKVSVTTQIYREINPNSEGLLRWLDERQQLHNVEDPKGNEHLFVDNDLPRDADITPMIMENTVGFALFTDDGDYIGSFRSLDRAIDAQNSASITISADVDADLDDNIMADAEA